MPSRVGTKEDGMGLPILADKERAAKHVTTGTVRTQSTEGTVREGYARTAVLLASKGIRIGRSPKVANKRVRFLHDSKDPPPIYLLLFYSAYT